MTRLLAAALQERWSKPVHEMSPAELDRTLTAILGKGWAARDYVRWLAGEKGLYNRDTDCVKLP